MFDNPANLAPQRVAFPEEFEADYEDRVLREARAIIQRRFEGMEFLSCPETARDYLVIRFAGYSEEAFGCMFLTARHRVIAFEILFRGTLTGVSIHERVIAKRALENNAAAVILAHNHPSGMADPSWADTTVTRKVKDVLDLFEIRLLDHFVVGGNTAVSMAERGFM